MPIDLHADCIKPGEWRGHAQVTAVSQATTAVDAIRVAIQELRILLANIDSKGSG